MIARFGRVGGRIARFLSASFALRRSQVRRRLLRFEPLLSRQVLAGFAVTGDSATLTLTAPNEQLSVTADASAYIVSTSQPSWSGVPVSGVVVSGSELRLSRTAFTGTIAIVDQAGALNSGVRFTGVGNLDFNVGIAIDLDEPGSFVVVNAGTNLAFGANDFGVRVRNALAPNSVYIDLHDNSSVATTSGSITFECSSNIVLRSETRLAAAGGGSVNISADNRIISQTQNATHVTATTATLTSGAGIELVTDVETVSVTVTQAGQINITDIAGGLTVSSASTPHGPISLTAAGGTLTLNNVSAIGFAITATQTGMGDIRVGVLTAGPNQTVSLLSAGQIIDLSDAAVDITAGDVVLQATTGIGISGSAVDTELEIAANTLDIRNTVSGGVQIDRPGGTLRVIAVNGGSRTINGSGHITAGGSLSIEAPLLIDGDFRFEAGNSSAPDDDLALLGALVIASVSPRSLVLRAGDDVIPSEWVYSLHNMLTSLLIEADREGAAVADGDRGSVSASRDNHRLSAKAIRITAPDGFGTSTRPIKTATNDLQVDTSGRNGSQYIVEEDNLPELSLNAGTGLVNLTVNGFVLSADRAIDIVSGKAVVQLNGAFGMLSDLGLAASGAAIETSVDELSVDNSLNVIYVRESNGLSALDLKAVRVEMVVVAGDVVDSDGVTDVVTDELSMFLGAGSLGTSSRAIGLDVLAWEANVAGAIYASNANSRFSAQIGGTNPQLTGLDATGVIDVRMAGRIRVFENVTTTAGDLTLQSSESPISAPVPNPALQDAILIAPGVHISTASGGVTLNAGDAVVANDNALIAATTFVVVNVDNAAGAIGLDNERSRGGYAYFDISGPADPVIIAPKGMAINGGKNVDVFAVKPSETAAITINGGSPGPAAMSSGDQLWLDISAVAENQATLLLGPSTNAGRWSFGANAAEQPIEYRDIEEFGRRGHRFHVVLDMAYAGFADSEADIIDVRRHPGASQARHDDLLELWVNNSPSPFFSSSLPEILSLTVIGSTDDDLLRITETTAGLPQFDEFLPTVGAVAIDNSGLGGGVSAGSHLLAGMRSYLTGATDSLVNDWDRSDVAFHFDGGGGPDVDRVRIVLTTPHNAAAVGTAASGNLATDAQPTELEGFVTGRLDLSLSFANLAPEGSLEWIAAGGMLAADATATPDTTSIRVRDYDLDAEDGVNQVTGDQGLIEQTFEGFGALYVVGGSGPETIVLESLDTNDPDGVKTGEALTLVTLDGDNLPTTSKLLFSFDFGVITGSLGTDLGNDTLQVETLPEGVTAILMGGGGDDRFLIYQDQDTSSRLDDSLDGFAGTVVVSPAFMLRDGALGNDERDGNDTLVIRDQGDGRGETDLTGDTVSIVSTRQAGRIIVNGRWRDVESTGTTVQGLFDDAPTSSVPQIVYSRIESLIVELTPGADTVTLDYRGFADELRTVEIAGNEGNDVFALASDSPSGADQLPGNWDLGIAHITLSGDAGDDTFSFANSADLFGSQSRVDGGVGNDALDFSSFTVSRAVYLVTTGAADGFQGYEGSWGVRSTAMQAASEQGNFPRFTNIDTLRGSAAQGDALFGPDRETYWDLSTRDTGTLFDGIPASIESECPCGVPDGQSLAFGHMENLFGGEQRDWFDARPGFQLTGAIGGGDLAGVSDTLDLRDFTVAVAVNLTAQTASFAGGIDTLPSGAAVANPSLRSAAGRPAFNSVGSSFENVLGGAGRDTLIGDADVNWLAGFAGDDILDGKAGVDSIDGGWGRDTLTVAGSEAENDTLVGGPGEPLDARDLDFLVNVGSLPVTLRTFNNAPDGFEHSLDQYEGNGVGLVISASGGQLRLGSTLLTNTPTVTGGAGNDAITISYENSVTTVYRGGAGTSDAVMLTFEPRDLQAMPFADIVAIQAFLAAPLAASLTLSGAANKGNFTVANDFESARIAVYDSGQVVDITACFTGLATASQIRFGTTGNDSLAGTAAIDLIFGLSGNDRISGANAADCLFGGEGNDTISGGDGGDTISGGDGADSLLGEAANDRLLGGPGNDSLLGAAGSDLLEGHAGNDVLNGGADPDSLFGGAGNDSLDGQVGNDFLAGQAGDDILQGGDGDDSLNGGADSRLLTARDTVNGGAGNDVIVTRGAESEFDVIIGGAGVNSLVSSDTGSRPADLILHEFIGRSNGIRLINGNGARIRGNASDNDLDFRLNPAASDFVRITAVPAIDGGAGDDEIFGTNAADSLLGGSGNDTLFGYGLDDRLDGGAGNDIIQGGLDADTLWGGAGNDVLRGEAGNDSLYGGWGNDSLIGLDGNDLLDGQQGADSLDAGVGDDAFSARDDQAEFDTLSGGAGYDRLLNAGAGNLVLDGFNGPFVLIEELNANSAAIVGNGNANLFDFRSAPRTVVLVLLNLRFVSGEAGDDTIRGSGIAETFFGGDGNDQLFGNAGADVLDGGAGDDRLEGETGNDLLTGDLGNDMLDGGDGNDTLNGGEGVDSISGGAGDDELRTQGRESFADTISGGLGADRIVNTRTGADLMFRNFDATVNGLETLVGGNAAIVGDDGPNTFDFRLSAAGAAHVALVDVTRIEMGNGRDTVHGSAGNDTIFGGGGDDVLNAWSGDDTISGGGGGDTIAGGSGNDTIIVRGSEAEFDLLSGGDGVDRLLNTAAGLNVVLNALVAMDSQLESFDANQSWLVGNIFNNTFDLRLNAAGTNSLAVSNLRGIDGMQGDDVIHGTVNADTIRGGTGNDLIFGYAGADLLNGNEGDDTLHGGDGDDSLIGEMGADRLTGGAGTDIFRFEVLWGVDGDVDLLADFDADVIRFIGYAFASGPVTYAQLVLSDPATDTAMLHLTESGSTVNSTTIKRISVPRLAIRPLSTQVLFI